MFAVLESEQEENMSIEMGALNRAGDKKKLNEEWMVLKNDSERPFNLDGCSIVVGKGPARPRVFHTFKAGVVIQAGETVRLVTGSSGKKSHGQAPEEEGIRNVHLFLKAAYLSRPGTTVRLNMRQKELCRGTV